MRNGIRCSAVNERSISKERSFTLAGIIAINHQVAERPVEGREAIRKMFAEADMPCILESIFEDGEWAIME